MLRETKEHSIKNSGNIWKSKKMLVMKKNANLPDRCIITNQPARGRRKKIGFIWTPWYIIFVLIFLGPLIWFIARSLATKTATIEVGISDEILLKQKRLAIKGALYLLCGIGLVVIYVAKIGNLADTDSIYGMPFWLLMVLLSGLTALGFGMLKLFDRNIIHVAKIDKEYIYLKGVSPDYLSIFPDWGKQRGKQRYQEPNPARNN